MISALFFFLRGEIKFLATYPRAIHMLHSVIFSVDVLVLVSINTPLKNQCGFWQHLFNYTGIGAGAMLVVTLVFIV